MKPIVAIIGRPNVGKSTLFNRITRTKSAIVDDVPGVTRDRHYSEAVWDEKPFVLVDTGGFLSSDDNPFADQISFQVRQAMADADAIVFLLDGKSGCSPFDRDLINALRSTDKPVFYTVNKIDGLEQENLIYEFHALGIDTLYPVSAEHGYGVRDLLDDLTASFPARTADAEENAIHIAVVGRPNVGKSSLINRILGQDRHVVSDMPGTTRDAVDSFCRVDGQAYVMIDTAGIRRKGKVSQKLEKFSVIKALRSLERCDVALIVLDALEGVTDQDLNIAGYAHERGCGCIFLLNKWDLVDRDTSNVRKALETLRDRSQFLAFAPALTVSAKTGQRISKIFSAVQDVHTQYCARIGTGPLNRILEQAVQRNEPPMHRGRRIKFYYATQVKTKPPAFVLFVNYPGAVHFSYRRYLTNRIREGANLDKTPLRMYFRERKGR